MHEMLLTVEQAAERLQLRPFTVREQLKAGKLRGVKRGRVWRVPESALTEEAQPTQPTGAALDVTGAADGIWAAMTSGDAQRHNDALRVMFRAPEAVQAIVMQRSAKAAAVYYATPEGEAELADWRALDGLPFHDDEDDEESAGDGESL